MIILHQDNLRNRIKVCTPIKEVRTFTFLTLKYFMKKRVLLLTAIGGIFYLTLSSYTTGPALNSQNRSGAKSSVANCGGPGCHGSSAASSDVAVTITVDSSGTPVSEYVPGNTYTVNINATFPTTQPAFGFQYAVVSGTGGSQIQAGSNSSLPTHVASHTFSGLHFIEHTTQLAASSGTGSVSFSWTAPAAGTGNVTMYCTVNAVNDNNEADGGDISNNSNKVLTELTTTGIASVANNADVKAYPNPVTNVLNIETDVKGAYNVSVYDLNGKMVTTQNVNAGNATTTVINTNNWIPGMYEVTIEKQGSRTVIPVVKK